MTASPPPDVGRLIDRLRDAGVELYRRGDRLRYRCAPGALTPALRAAAAAHRAALLARLPDVGPHPCAGCGRHAFPRPDTRCFWCRRDPSGARRGP